MKKTNKPTLYIDTTKNEVTIVGVVRERQKKLLKQKTDNLSSQNLLPMIEKLLQQEKMDLKDLKGIEVESGPGSFTGTRVGVSVANALGWTLKIPVNGQKIVLPIYSASKFD